MKYDKKKMKEEHWEKDAGYAKCANMKYSNVPNPESLKRNEEKLAKFVDNHRMKYD
ncbi:MAG: hypothetical protein PQJ44_06860 [Sphaerochaetaceae bacterium]|nr:hypothetical protein [Sphaerochaetaceae bacterium]